MSERIAEECGSHSIKRTFLSSKKVIQFGFHLVAGKNIILSENGLEALRQEPDNDPYDAVVYGGEPLKGTAEFEVEILHYNDSKWRGSVQIGVMRLREGNELEQHNIPRLSECGDNHCIWLYDEVYNRLDQKLHKTDYSTQNLQTLREYERVGLQLTHEGDLYFFMKGKCLGLAASGVYMSGYDVYPVVDVSGGCRAVKITRAGQKKFSLIC